MKNKKIPQPKISLKPEKVPRLKPKFPQNAPATVSLGNYFHKYGNTDVW
jgi:hypothetical protein